MMLIATEAATDDHLARGPCQGLMRLGGCALRVCVLRLGFGY